MSTDKAFEGREETEKNFAGTIVEKSALELAEGSVSIEVCYSSVNYKDALSASGSKAVTREYPHVPGIDAAGTVLASTASHFAVGDEVVVHCNQDDGDDEECNGGDPMYSTSQRIWGYETPDGSFSQFTRVQSQQLMPRPQHQTWEESACYTLTLATAYRMLFGHAPHELKPGQNVLIWGASGGLGSYAVQLANVVGPNAIGVISDESQRDFVMALGANGVIHPRDFNCLGAMPTLNTPQSTPWF